MLASLVVIVPTLLTALATHHARHHPRPTVPPYHRPLAANSSHPRIWDHKDPRDSNCDRSAAETPNTEVPVKTRDGIYLGDFSLVRSLDCETEWGRISRLESSPGLTATIVVTRPATRTSDRYVAHDIVPAGVYGNMLGREPGCIAGRAIIRSHGRPLATARTPCM